MLLSVMHVKCASTHRTGSSRVRDACCLRQPRALQPPTYATHTLLGPCRCAVCASCEPYNWANWANTTTKVPIIKFPSLAPTILEVLGMQNVRGDMPQNLTHPQPILLSKIMPKLPVIPNFKVTGELQKHMMPASSHPLPPNLVPAPYLQCVVVPRQPNCMLRHRWHKNGT